jgi:hypothetical protein
MPNDVVPAIAGGLPTINRRRMLLGLAAASTAAATVTVEAAAAPAENPNLIALIEELPAIAEAFHRANDAYRAMEKKWNVATPRAPDELTVPGRANPYDDQSQPGEAEMYALGGYIWRKGEEFPRRIIVKSWQVYSQLGETRRQLRKAKKAGSVADCLLLEEEIKRLKKLLASAEAYEAEFAKARKQARANHERLWPAKDATQEALERHVDAIMREKDFTMEGVVIKAQALAEWDRVGGKGLHKLAFRHGLDWHGLIAASVLRHANGGGS